MPASAQEARGEGQPPAERPEAKAGDDAAEKDGASEKKESKEADQADAAEPAPPPATRTENTVVDLGRSDETVTFTFQEAPWPEVLAEFADWAGLTLDLTDVPAGYFNYYDNRELAPREAIDILNGYLLPRGYTVLRRDQFLVVIKTDNEMLSSLVPTVDLDQLPERGDNELVRIVVPVDTLTPDAAAAEIEPLLGPYGSVTALPNSGSVVIQGFGSTLDQALAVLRRSAPPITDDKLDFRAFQLQHLRATEAERQIRNLFGLQNGTLNVSGARSEVERAMYLRNRSRSGGDRDRDRDKRDKDERNAPPIPLLQMVAMNMQVSSLDRTNSLLVTATPEGLALVEQILTSVDVPEGDAAAALQSDTEPELRVYRITEADEEEVAKTLDVLLPGLVVNEDRRQDTIHVMATPQEHREVADVIRTLDGLGEGARAVDVITLRRANPYVMEELLTAMFENEDRDVRPVIRAELQSRTLVVRGTESQIAQVRDALTAYGEGDAADTAQNRSRVRRIKVGGHDAEAIAEAARTMFSVDEDSENSIRVVVPGDEKSKRRERSEKQAADEVEMKKDRETALLETRRFDIGQPRRETLAQLLLPSDTNGPAPAQQVRELHGGGKVRLAMSRSDSAEPRSDDDADSQPEQSQPRARVTVETRGDELYLYSGDPEALAEVEETIRDLLRQMPERTRWTIFYLRAAEASETATRLYDLVEQASAADAYAGYPQDPAAQPLRIITDPRTNALFVSGSDTEVDQIEGFLEFLDVVDPPETMRERRPHTIAVEYANVNEVAEMIRELYKDYLTDPAAERRRNERDGRDRGGNRNRDSGSGGQGSASTGPSPGIRLTLAVDPRTSQLLVSCDEPLFREIEALVTERDQAVRNSEPTVEYVEIGSTLPTDLAGILEGMSAKVSTEIIEIEEQPQTSREGSRQSVDNRRRRNDRN